MADVATVAPREILARAEKRLTAMVARGADPTLVVGVFRTYEALYLQATAPVVDDTMALVEVVAA